MFGLKSILKKQQQKYVEAHKTSNVLVQKDKKN